MTAFPKSVDSKGRLALGKSYANQLVLVNELADGVIQIVRAKAIPEPELWLHSNDEAIRLVMEGIRQARDGELADGPDLVDATRLAGEMGE